MKKIFVAFAMVMAVVSVMIWGAEEAQAKQPIQAAETERVETVVSTTDEDAGDMFIQVYSAVYGPTELLDFTTKVYGDTVVVNIAISQDGEIDAWTIVDTVAEYNEEMVELQQMLDTARLSDWM